MENSVTLLLADYDLLKRVQEKVSQLLEFDKNKDRYVKIGHSNSYDITIKNSVEGDVFLANEITRLNNENEFLQHEVERLTHALLKCQVIEHTMKKWSLSGWIKRQRL